MQVFNISSGILRQLAGLLTGGLIAAQACAGVSEVDHFHDAHIHYDQDVWESLGEADALRMLQQEGIERALVSATPGEGAEKLYLADPGRVVPMLRPYKSWRHRYLWFRDPKLEQYLRQQLSRVPYRGFGEFHVLGEDMIRPPVLGMIEIAREKQMVLHAHTDLTGMRLLLEKANDLPVIWAHGGFDVPIETLEALLTAHSQLYIELSYREGLLQAEGKLTRPWKQFLLKYPDRFLVGMDTWKPSRWARLPELAEQARNWLSELPEDAAQRIARGNFDRLFPCLAPDS